MHKPVLLQEVMTYLNLQPGDFAIDGTIDGGGHARQILGAVGEEGALLGVDWDPEMIEHARETFGEHDNVILVAENYANLPDILQGQDLPRADGLLLDIGFSSEQLTRGRGLSYREDEPLLMTYADDRTPLRDTLPTLSEKEIIEIIHTYGEERYAKRIGGAIYRRQQESPIQTSGELARTVEQAAPRPYERGRMHPATRTFQAFRIYVNQELENLKELLSELTDILASGGRAVVISFHSLEDRIVKHTLRDMAKEGVGEVLTKKPIRPTEEETRDNPRARSAKLRAFQLA